MLINITRVAITASIQKETEHLYIIKPYPEIIIKLSPTLTKRGKVSARGNC